ncbi:hypothetical protein EYR38_007272 [Pleurotus pulmonarius]|nr:hypothetical protein EYR38_007272 [Pleurotus pulmonarius]
MDSDAADTDRVTELGSDSEGQDAQNKIEQQPRSRRVGMQLTNPPPSLVLSLAALTYTGLDTITTSPPPPQTPTTSDKPLPRPPLVSPPLPPRSPLRQPPRRNIAPLISTAPSRDSQNSNESAESHSGHTPIETTEDFPAEASRESIMSITQLLEEINSAALIVQPSTSAMMNGTMSKSVPAKPSGSQRPDSPPLPIPSSPKDTKETKSKAKAMTKRQHALHELLSSERAFASDLALIREVHIPLAMGLPASFSLPAAPQEGTSTEIVVSNGSRTLSTASSSTASSASTNFSSASSSTAATSVSSSSTYTPFSTSNPPLSPLDTKVIFSNIAELAFFSDKFCDLLEEALGAEIEGGQGEDRVGDLFCRVISDLEAPYKQYITKHPTALARLAALTKGLPAPDDQASEPSQQPLSTYLALTQRIASTHSHAWDLPSLLIKPVQRLLKYPLLIQAIIDATPPSHSDYQRLKEAKERTEEVARAVNEERRRKEVVMEVLEKGKKGAGIGILALKDLIGMEAIGSISGLVGVAASPKKKGLGGKMKGLKSPMKGASTDELDSGFASPLSHNGSTVTLTSTFSGANTPMKDTNSESLLVLALAWHLDETYAFLHKFAKEIVSWSRVMKKNVEALETWARAFGRVIGLSVDPSLFDDDATLLDESFGVGSQGSGGSASGGAQGSFSQSMFEEEVMHSEAFDAFINLVRSKLLPLTAQLEKDVTSRLLDPMTKLVQSMNEPRILINAMNGFRPIHDHLLNTPITSSSGKNRPSPSLLQASSTYLALRGQLATELPLFVELLNKGVKATLKDWVDLQVEYWKDTRVQWMELWEMLRVEGEGNGGATETIGIWESRWREVDEVLQMLPIVRPIVGSKEKEREKEGKKDKNKAKDKWRARSGSVGTNVNTQWSASVAGTLESLGPTKTGSSKGRSSTGTTMSEGSVVTRAGGITSMLASLDPLPAHHGSSSYSGLPSPGFGQGNSGGIPYVSGPLPLAPRGRTRGGSEMPLRHGGSSMYDIPGAIRRDPSSHGDVGASHSSSRYSGGSGSSGRPGAVDPDETLGLSAARTAQAKRGSSRSRRDQQQVDAVPTTVVDYRIHGDPGFGDLGESEYYQADMADYLVALGLDHSSDSFVDYAAVEESPTVRPTPSSSAPRPKPSMQPRTKSMPTLTQASGGNSEVPSLRSSTTSAKILLDEKEREEERDRGRSSRKPSIRRKFTDSLRSSHSSSSSIQNQAQQSPSQPRRHRSPSAKSTSDTYFYVDPNAPPTPGSNATSFAPSANQGYVASNGTGTSRKSWSSAPAKYVCQVVHACTPPSGVSYFSYPFFRLVEGHLYEVLHEAGHPSMHPKLPLHVDDGADCLLLVRDVNNTVGWALASFLIPLEDI